jgi:hypothetical protein
MAKDTYTARRTALLQEARTGQGDFLELAAASAFNRSRTVTIGPDAGTSDPTDVSASFPVNVRRISGYSQRLAENLDDSCLARSRPLR